MQKSDQQNKEDSDDERTRRLEAFSRQQQVFNANMTLPQSGWSTPLSVPVLPSGAPLAPVVPIQFPARNLANSYPASTPGLDGQRNNVYQPARGGLPSAGTMDMAAYQYALQQQSFINRGHPLRPAVAPSEAYKQHPNPLMYGGVMGDPYGRDLGSLAFAPNMYQMPHAGLTGHPLKQGNMLGKRPLDTSVDAQAKRKKEATRKKKKSKYRGVFWHSRGKAWVSSIMVNGKTTHLGYYDCEVEAARVYDKEAIRLKGVTCAVNFPDSVEHFGKNKDAPPLENKRSTRHERKRAERISKYRGVCWNKCNSSWKACIKIDGRNKHIGYFSSEKDAAKAYDAKAKEVRGDAAKLNFPHSDEEKEGDVAAVKSS